MKTVLTTLSVLLLIVISKGSAQSPPAKQQALTPLEKVLNPDGTIDTHSGFTGSIDPRGWHMQAAANGAPRFFQENNATQVSSLDDSWDSRFTYPGAAPSARAFLAVSDTEVYAAGPAVAGAVIAGKIVKWNGDHWSAVDHDINAGDVTCIAVIATDIYVGGTFLKAGGITVNSVAKWNGSAWSSLAGGVSGGGFSYISALAVIGSDLYAGGAFLSAGGVSANNIAKWNGSSWSALGAGTTSSVTALAVIGTDLYACGDFIWKWNGSSWADLGGLDWTAWSMGVIGTDLYIGGRFTSAGGVAANGIAKWNGSAWSALGTGVTGAFVPSVQAIAAVGTDLFVGGAFTFAGGVSALGIAKWDGTSWSSLGTGVNSYVGAMAATSTSVYVSGSFTTAGGIPAHYHAKWDGSTWSPLDKNGAGMSDGVTALAISGPDLYAGGAFLSAGGVRANHVAKWNGGNWDPLGSGTNGGVLALAVSGSDVYVGGQFDTAGGIQAKNIARWDGSRWHSLGSGVSGNGVQAIAISGANVYVGGQGVSLDGGLTYIGVARWDGNSWSAVGTGFAGYIYALAVSGTDLYAGGMVLALDGVNLNNIAKWNGSTWSGLGGGVSGTVYALAVNGSVVYVAGQFQVVGVPDAVGIAQWDGSTWSALGTGLLDGQFVGSGRALAAAGNDLYVGGGFVTAGGVVSHNIAKWNGSTWSALGSGASNPSAGGSGVYSLASIGSVLYAGGGFVFAGGKASAYFGAWQSAPVSTGSLAFGTVPVGGSKIDSVVFHNPFGGTLTISSAASSSPRFTVTPPSAVIAPGGNQTFHITFSPAGVGSTGGIISFVHDGPNSPGTVTVDGTGIAPVFSAMPAGVAFGNVPPGSMKKDSVTVRNAGALILNISSALSSDTGLTVNPTTGSIAVPDSEEFYFTYSAPAGIHRLQVDTVTFLHNGVGSSSRIVCTADNRINDSMQTGWNMVSVPTILNDYLKSSVYPTATSAAFSYGSGYQKQDTLKPGDGYWVKFGGAGTMHYSGGSIAAETVDVQTGWNMIGSISSTVAVSNISSIAGGIITSAFFGYNNGYSIADSIRPGAGYWVKVHQFGKLIFSSSPSNVPASRIQVVPGSELPPTPPNGADVERRTSDVPHEFALEQNYPNPFNPATVIRYSLPVNSRVTLKIYDLLGQEVATLVDGIQDAGFESVEWSPTSLSSGLYFYRIEATSAEGEAKIFTEIKKLLLLR